ncbi:hypothetical protein PF005_g5649 [Phytophthora fragariae]|uniref:COMM domain-containing protein n=1 Tax=Phytophthora fragariae TaxID=53985 RepID=A0A6A3LSF3_9STRA|nr:hypothetical protein PF003_g33453 [Phytophthora fragariae]KAE8944209.1 hypothetical protein PF009_g6104 [Phytophthora fragariae]KAE9022119.1 hypothetical protein PF011_g4629 [Phytophthora fragariae]KAE9126999.1 hypothetical protein PF007_g5777 [Phytophthora fragariae]KAE9127016.1 hypothetical protein PF010_g5080 [Phytophthora fragariae]
MTSVQAYAVLNAVARDKLGQVLARVLEKMAANESEAFTASEKDQLQSMLGLSAAQIDEVVAVAVEIFRDAATFGHVDRNLLLSRGVGDSVAHAVEKTWRKKGRALAGQIAAFHAVETPSLVLHKTDWRLHLEMGSSKLSGQSQPTAIFQLEVAHKNSPTNETERMDVELSHAELRSLFLQLNAVQAELDAPPAPSAA